MHIPPVQQPVTFGYSSILKTEFKRGNIPLKKDITGHKITKKDVTLDHTVPKSRGGKSRLENYSLMNRDVNWERGSLPLKDMVETKSLIDYIIVMLDVKTKDLDGIEYLKKWLPNLRKEI